MARKPVICVVLAALLVALRPAAQSPVPFVYVSGYRPEIAIFRLDTSAGTLSPVARAAEVGEQPSFLAWDPGGRFLFAVNETDPGRVRSFAIDRRTGGITPLNDVPAMGSITAHLSTDKTGRWLLVANHGDLEPRVYPVPVEIDEEVARLKLRGMGFEIYTLTPEQEAYLKSWEEGT